MSISATPAWQALADHAEALRGRHLRELFAADAARFDNFSIDAEGCLFDFSKQIVTAETIRLLAALADAADVRAIFESIGPGYRSYFPVYSDFTSAAGVTTHNVIGFGYGRIDGPASGSGSLQLKYTLDFDTRHVPSAATIVAYDNASATITRRRLRNDVPSDVWEQLFSRAVEFTYPPIAPSLPAQVSGDWRDVRVGSVLAPALTR